MKTETAAKSMPAYSPEEVVARLRTRMPCLPLAANSGEYAAAGASGSSSPRSASISAARLVTVLVEDQTFVMACSDHGIARVWSQKPPHKSMTVSPSMSATSDAPSSSPESRFPASASRTAANRLRPSHLLVRDPSMDDVFLALTGRPDPDIQPGVGAVAGLGAGGNDDLAGEGSTA
jgi:hypothetical protein